MKNFDEIMIDCTKHGRKIKKGDYLDEGEYPIIDQGQQQCIGYSNVVDGLFTDVPAIIFGDHTRIVKYIDEPFYLGADGVKVLRSKNSNADYRYLYYAIRNVRIENTGYNRHFKWLKESKFRYPELKQQQEIASILWKVERIIELKEKELEELDTLIRSRFVEMFGDPGLNPMMWPIGSLASICTKITDGEHASVKRVETGKIFLNARNITTENKMNFDGVTFVSEEDHNRIYKRCNPEKGDLLITTTGTIGNLAIVQDEFEVSMDRGITLLKLDFDQVNSLYLLWLLQSKFIRMQMVKNIHASALAHLYLNQVRALNIIIPSIEVQNLFAKFVEQVDKLKGEVQKSLDETQILFDSLVQKYFE